MEYRLPGWIYRNRAARDKRDRLKHLTHMDGLCGAAVAACCSECYADEITAMREWAKDKPRPNVGEDVGDYWRRIGGAFYDAWYVVAKEQFQRQEVR